MVNTSPIPVARWQRLLATVLVLAAENMVDSWTTRADFRHYHRHVTSNVGIKNCQTTTSTNGCIGQGMPQRSFSSRYLHSNNRRKCTTTILFSAPLPPPPGSSLLEQSQYVACMDFMENHQQEQDQLLKRDRKIYLIPIVVAILSYTFFPQTQQLFHSTLTTLSLGEYTGELSTDIRPLINGPVTLTISILFGSLVSMTIGTLYGRQTDIHSSGIETINEVRHMQFLAEALPEPEKTLVKTELNLFTLQRLRAFFRGDLFAKDQRNVNIAPLLLILQKAQQNPSFIDGPYLGELYASVGNLKQIWIKFVAATQRDFTPAHYINLFTQATALLMIYLWETDDAAFLEAHTFELSVAWAILLSTMASLAAIIVDLSTPISNIITMIRLYDVDMDEMIAFGLAKDLPVEREILKQSLLDQAATNGKEIVTQTEA